MDAISGVLTWVAGNGTLGSTGDGGPALNAQLHFPKSMCFDKAGSMYIADTYNYLIRKVTEVVNVPEFTVLDFDLHPNPSNGVFNLSTKQKIKKLEVKNLLGQTIYSQIVNSPKAVFDITNHLDGMYIVVVYGSQSYATKKIIVRH